MMHTAKKMYELLPAFYRSRDVEQGEPLKALFNVLAEQAGVMEADIWQLYENWFIETCADWVVPYMADLLGIKGVNLESSPGYNLRAYVANTLRYRRRKGTAPVLEQLALDITGWRSRVVEFFERLITTQNVNHIRLHNPRTPDLRRTRELELIDTAFDTTAHTVDVRHIASGRGRHNIPNIGLFLWRLQSYPLMRASARPVEIVPDGRYTFSPLGYDSHLFNRPQTEKEITHLAEEINVPGLLRRRPLYDELEARRQAIVDEREPEYSYFDDRKEGSKNPPVLQIYLDGNEEAVKAEEIVICNLEKWHIPEDEKTYIHLESDGTAVDVKRKITAAVDPESGRLTFPASVENTLKQVQVSYAYGFSGDIGGGPYNRQSSIPDIFTGQGIWQVGVSEKIGSDQGPIFKKLCQAIEAWNEKPEKRVGVIAIMDNHTYKEDLTGDTYRIKIPAASRLLIVAAGWPEVADPQDPSGPKIRLPGQFSANERRPHIHGDIQVVGTESDMNVPGGELVLDGLLVEGKLTVLSGNLGGLRVSHGTLVPDKNGSGVFHIKSKNKWLEICMARSICGKFTLGQNAMVKKVSIEESILDNGVEDGKDETITLAAVQSDVVVEKSTVFGKLTGRSIVAGNSIFTGIVDIERLQAGCIRFSFIPEKSRTPRRFRCQPELEIRRQIAENKEKEEPESTEEEIETCIRGWLVPAFTSMKYGYHAYAQLSRTCPLLIRTGAEDGSEMGVFNHLKQPQRQANLLAALDEYLRFGLEAGIIYVT